MFFLSKIHKFKKVNLNLWIYVFWCAMFQIENVSITKDGTGNKERRRVYMRRKFKRFLALTLSAALCVTGINYTKVNTQAADRSAPWLLSDEIFQPMQRMKKLELSGKL